ncbi:YqjF family protein [Mucilaginibacter calamicampi]|uniref:YqjF family protein n=1 Tax=Mucilaginibacter calamicampi TaxID=1302352 RepID=A0ABW2YQV0_9SPHI
MPTKTFLTANWLNLIMLNYEVDPAILKQYVPAGTELDLWEGKALVSMVGFLFDDTRVLGIRWPFHVNFEEVNLRFYVKYFDGTVWKRGAVFISELVPKHAIALIANNLYREHYRALPMRSSIIPISENQTQHLYEWKLSEKWNKLGATVMDEPTDIASGSAEEFIFEHYWGYNIWNATTTMEYEVQHVPWQVRQVTDYVFDADVAALYGDTFVPYLQRKPYSAFFANGSAIGVRMGEKIRVDK